jgi:hypothetical protein
MTTHLLASCVKGRATTYCGQSGPKSMGTITKKHVDCQECLDASTHPDLRSTR